MSFRRTIALLLACLWASAPLLACLPSPSMTAAEMECCKKMAGNCDMGGGHHKCCDTALNHAAPSAATVQSAAPQVPVLAITALLGQAEMLAAQPASGLVSFVPAASPSPPGLSNVLRI